MVVWYIDSDSEESEQASPFRRWTTGNGTGSSYRHHDPRNMYNKQMSEGSHSVANGVGGSQACGGVARWSLGLEHLLADPDGYAAFSRFLEREFAAENIRFWCLCEKYSKCEDPVERAAVMQCIWQQHLAERAPDPVNVDAAARRATALRLHVHPPPLDLFTQAQRQIFNVMKFDSYQRFLKSDMHAECARADLCGAPLPYSASSHPPAGPVCHLMDSPKLKKSASNVSERRRSGALLLSWRSRAASRDRERDRTTPEPNTNSNQNNNNITAAQQTRINSDGLSCPYVLGEKRCRVELPDSVKTVVNVDGSETVRQLVDRLLKKRNIHCPTYDVLFKVQNEVESISTETSGQVRQVNVNSPAASLGGREVRVERRCELRVEVCGRCVAVRCRPGKTLRLALRPVVARYCRQPQPSHAPAPTATTTPLCADTLVQDIDGAKLRIVPTGGNEFVVERLDRSGTPSSGVAVDIDCDSVSELAVRLHDGVTRDADAHSGSSRSECGSSCAASVASLPTASGVAGGGPSALGVSSSVAGGRVRAALRPGPPLHHHPPDFLENLRETQRIRLNAQVEARPNASNHTPPPLPPKPAPRRQPTLV